MSRRFDRIRLWKATTLEPIREFPVPMGWHLALSPDGKTLASAHDDGSVGLWETATGKERLRFNGHEGPVQQIAFAPDGRTLASAGTDSTILLWDLTGRKAKRWPQPTRE
jgi:WD40 repeat protein